LKTLCYDEITLILFLTFLTIKGNLMKRILVLLLLTPCLTQSMEQPKTEQELGQENPKLTAFEKLEALERLNPESFAPRQRPKGKPKTEQELGQENPKLTAFEKLTALERSNPELFAPRQRPTGKPKTEQE
jgi:hypothetical protein